MSQWNALVISLMASVALSVGAAEPGSSPIEVRICSTEIVKRSDTAVGVSAGAGFFRGERGRFGLKYFTYGLANQPLRSYYRNNFPHVLNWTLQDPVGQGSPKMGNPNGPSLQVEPAGDNLVLWHPFGKYINVVNADGASVWRVNAEPGLDIDQPNFLNVVADPQRGSFHFETWNRDGTRALVYVSLNRGGYTTERDSKVRIDSNESYITAFCERNGELVVVGKNLVQPFPIAQSSHVITLSEKFRNALIERGQVRALAVHAYDTENIFLATSNEAGNVVEVSKQGLLAEPMVVMNFSENTPLSELAGSFFQTREDRTSHPEVLRVAVKTRNQLRIQNILQSHQPAIIFRDDGGFLTGDPIFAHDGPNQSGNLVAFRRFFRGMLFYDLRTGGFMGQIDNPSLITWSPQVVDIVQSSVGEYLILSSDLYGHVHLYELRAPVGP